MKAYEEWDLAFAYMGVFFVLDSGASGKRPGMGKGHTYGRAGCIWCWCIGWAGGQTT